MERPEAQDAGTIILTGFDIDNVLNSVKIVIEENNLKNYTQIPHEYAIQNTSWRVLKLIQGVAKLSNMWFGVKK